MNESGWPDEKSLTKVNILPISGHPK